MPFMPLTSDEINEALNGAIKEGSNVSATTIERRRKGSIEKKWLAKVTKQLNEMLANPRFAFRNIETLGTVLDDEPPFTLTRNTLKRLPDVRRSTLKNNAWIKENNWVWRIDEKGRRKVAKNDSGHYILEKGVPEGRI